MKIFGSFLLSFISVAAMAAVPSLAAVEPSMPAKTAKADGKTHRPNMLPQPATTDELIEIDPSRFGARPADPAFGAYQRGLYLTALSLAKPRAEAGDAAAQTLLGEIYARGLGVPVDPKLAAQWYGKAAAQDNVHAQFQYAVLLLDGKHVKADRTQAEALMKKAAIAGNAMAQFNYAQILMQNNPGEKGIEAAYPWFQKAAQNNLSDAEYAVSQILANGTAAIKQNEAEARVYLLRAAQKNYDTAQLDLATWLVEGRGGERDFDAGFKWMLQAARNGNVAAQARLARLYRDGLGTDGNTVMAAAWYFVARRSGLTAFDLDSMLDGLEDEQIERARTLSQGLRQ
ncbi:tetratricopeptide repeat protein [Paenochrobactrum sp. BZR 588]|uniref:tetratricopeptide repeat protein n=1 Tax=Paenochrobactrum TaxID=999488 RepID=UPI0035BBB0CC